MKKVMKVCHMVGNALTAVSVVALLVMVVITILDVFLRQLFKAPITGAVEITRMMMICMSPAFVSALFEGRHVSVGLVVDNLGRKGQLAFDTVCYVATSAVSFLMCYQGFVEMSKKMSQNQVYTMLKIPTWPFYLIFAVSMGFFAVAVLVKLVDNYVDKAAYDKPVEGGGH